MAENEAAKMTVGADMAVSPLVVILGPTASGKSTLAIELARRIGAEILSVDSMQVYRGMDIGTAKPSASERREVVHHLIDVVNPDQPFTVAKFVESADALIADVRARRRPLIATGGTPLYYKSLFEGLFEGPSADEKTRQRLNKTPPAALHERLLQVDPAAGARIHMNDRRRLVRALEVYELTGKPISAHQTEWASQSVRHPATWFGLRWERDELNRRINLRVKQMMEQGWIEETRALIEKYPTLSQTAAEATGYHELIEHVLGRISLDEAMERIKIATRQLARRQMKWFRRFGRVTWLEGSDDVRKLADEVQAKLTTMQE